MLNYEEYARNVLSNSDHINYDMFNLLKGKFYNILTTQNGSRILQKAITKTNKEILSWILFEIIEQVNELIVNPYANYFMQKFFIVLKTSDRLIFLSKLKVIELSKSKIGTYPMQSFIEQLSHKEEKQIILDAIRNDILNLCYVRSLINCRIVTVYML